MPKKKEIPCAECLGCFHYRRVWCGWACHFSLDVGKIRGGTAAECREFKKVEVTCYV